MNSKILTGYRLSMWIMWLNYALLVFVHNENLATIFHVVAMAIFMIIIEVRIRMGLNHDYSTKE